MSVSVGQAQVHESLKKLRMQWSETRRRWKDGVAAEFEENYWTPLDGAAKSALAAMERLAQVMVQLRGDCGLEGEEIDLTVPSDD